MFRSILFPLLLLLSVSSVSAQCTKKISELPVAPELLFGLRLGMTKEQIQAKIPQTKFGRPDPFGVVKTTINPFFDETIDKTKFQGVRSISLDLLDEKLTSIWIGFDENFTTSDSEEFLKFLTQSLLVDGKWSSWKSRGMQMRCADFQVIATKVAGGPSFRLLDTAADDLVAQRRQQKEEQDAAAEAAASSQDSEESSKIVGDKQSKTYYPNGCQPAKAITDGNKVTFKTPAEAEKAGFKLARNCP